MIIELNEILINEIIEMAWADEVSFDKIKINTGISEPQIIKIMRRHLKPSSFRLWRARVTGRCSKHEKKFSSSKITYRHINR